jgi:hypothetical protein
MEATRMPRLAVTAAPSAFQPPSVKTHEVAYPG